MVKYIAANSKFITRTYTHNERHHQHQGHSSPAMHSAHIKIAFICFMCSLLSIEFIFISTLRLSFFLGVQSIFSMFNGAAVKKSEGRRCRKIVHVVAVAFSFFPEWTWLWTFFPPSPPVPRTPSWWEKCVTRIFTMGRAVVRRTEFPFSYNY